jgi:hypothetical protein
MINRVVFFLVVTSLVFVMPVPGNGFDSSKIPDQEEIMGWIDTVCAPDNRRPGEAGDLAGEDFIADKFKEFGLQHITKERVDITLWRAAQWALRVQTKNGEVLIPSFYTLNTGFTGEDGVTAEMVFVNTGSAADFEQFDVRGKIVVMDMEFAVLPILPLMLLKGYFLYDPQDTFTWWWAQPAIWVRKNWNVDRNYENSAYEMAREKGALAVVWILRDQPTNINSHYGPYDGVMKELPALYVGKYDGGKLRNLLVENGPAKGTVLQTGSTSPGYMHNVHGVLPGKSDEIILVSSHHDSPFKGYTEDGSGIAMVLSLARYFSRLPLEQREKTMVFYASAGHFYGSKGIMAWLENHKNDIVPRTVLNLNIEHVPAKEFIEGENGEFSDTGLPQLGGIFIDRNEHLKDAVKKAVINNNLERSGVIAIDALGPEPPGEGRFTHRIGIPVIHYISGPAYLLVDADNRDKINMPFLVPAAKTFIEIVERLSEKSRESLMPEKKEE